MTTRELKIRIMFLAKIKNEKRSESYFIEAVSYTDAEEIIASEFPYATIKAISGQKFSFVLKSDVEEDDRFFKCKIASISDEGTKSTMTALVQCSSAEHCIKRLNEEMEDWVSSENFIVSVSDSRAEGIINKQQQ